MKSTRPPGPRTGRVIEGCYAAVLRDCDGPLTAEHYVSNALLQRLDRNFTVEGFPWLSEPKHVGAASLTAKNLCQRHNHALSPLDATIRDFYNVLHSAMHTDAAPEVVFDGEDLERWALKVMVGMTTSGNVASAGRKARAREAPELYLRILFGEEEMPDRCGFKYVPAERPDLETNQVGFAIETLPHDSLHRAFGITVRILGFQFLTSITEPIEVLRGDPVFHRPDAFQIGDPAQGRILLRWGGRYSPSVGYVLELNRYART